MKVSITLLVYLVTQIWQHTWDLVSYCLGCFSSPVIPVNRPKQLQTRRDQRRQMGRVPPHLQLFGPIVWNGRGGKRAQAVRNRISSVPSYLGNQADEEGDRHFHLILGTPGILLTAYCFKRGSSFYGTRGDGFYRETMCDLLCAGESIGKTCYRIDVYG